jgi:hypothetical protein
LGDALAKQLERPAATESGMSLEAVLAARFRTPPYLHQLKEFEDHCDTSARALAWHMRTGKSKAVIDKTCHLFTRDKVDGLLIFAPNGAHANFVKREIPTHVWDGIKATCLLWQTINTGAKGVKRVRAAQRQGWHDANAKWWEDVKDVSLTPGLVVLAVNTESMIRKDVRKAVARFVANRRVHLVVDESDDFGTPGAARTKMLRALARRCPYRTLLSGTMTTGTPLAAFSQFEVLRPGALGFEKYGDFKHHFAVFENETLRNGRVIPKVVGFKNLDELRERMAPFTSVVLRSEVHDMPDIVPRVRDIEVTEEQTRVFLELKQELETTIGDEVLSFRDLQNKFGKLQQVFSGFVLDQAGRAHVLEDNPRLDALADEVYLTPGKVVVWCEFQKDFDLVAERLTLVEGHEIVQYHGRVSDKDKANALRSFLDNGAIKALVGHVQSGSRGLDMSSASKIIFYSHTWKARLRAQAIERATKIGGANIEVVDFRAMRGPDKYILKKTQERIDIGDQLTGRGLRDMLRGFTA